MISIRHGVYNGDSTYERDGYFHLETRKYLPIPLKFRNLLWGKWLKFMFKYNIKELFFTYGNDPDESIEAVAICHPKFDDFDELIGESIVIGRINRMRGNIRTPYNQNEETLDKEGSPTGILKYPWIFKLTR